jgi:S-adenosylmethionine decarboxylase proenzyme
MQEMKNQQLGNDAIGHHIIADLHGIKNSDTFDNIEIMKSLLMAAAKKAKMKVVSEAWYKFEPTGLTGVLVLASSHISVHYWPEKQFLHCDIFTCNDGVAEHALEYIIDALKPDLNKSKIINIDRSIYKETKPFGFSFLIDGLGCASLKDLDDIDIAYDFLNELTESIGMTKQSEPCVVRTDAKKFPDKRGLSGAVFLVESSITIHTISTADKRFVTVDCYSCRPFDKEIVKKVIKKYYKPKMFSKEQYLERGVEYHAYNDSRKA